MPVNVTGTGTERTAFGQEKAELISVELLLLLLLIEGMVSGVFN